MKDSRIEWTDHTFNPWIGCTKVSPGCANCYAEAQDRRWGNDSWGPGKPRRRTSASYWKQPLAWDKEASKDLAYWQAKRDRWIASGQADHRAGKEWLRRHDLAKPRRPRVFCASLSDWLDEEWPVEVLADLMDLSRRTPHLDWLLLTKRPQNWRMRISEVADITQTCSEFQWVGDWLDGTAPANVWVGTTVEDQQRADERIPELLRIPARVRFLSCEPLLGEVEIEDLGDQCDGGYVLGSSPIHWVICGGESGPKARPMHPTWARSLRDQCAAAGVPFFFKQWGEWLPWEWDEQEFNNSIVAQNGGVLWHDAAPRDPCNLPKGWDAFWFDGAEPDCTLCQRVGKSRAGRLLDGREHNEFPR